jgi:hypothetical protein
MKVAMLSASPLPLIARMSTFVQNHRADASHIWTSPAGTTKSVRMPTPAILCMPR